MKSQRALLIAILIPILARCSIVLPYDAKFEHPGYEAPHCTHQIPHLPQKFFLGFYNTFKALMVDFKDWKQSEATLRTFDSLYASTADSAPGIPTVLTQEGGKLRTVFFNENFTKLTAPVILSDKGAASLSNPISVSKTVYLVYSYRYNPGTPNVHKFFKVDMSDLSEVVLPILEGSFDNAYQESSSYIIGTISATYVVVDHT